MSLLREIALQLGAIGLVAASFKIYFDGLERLHNLEANLWAVAVLFSSGSVAFFDLLGTVATVLLVVFLYGVRTRFGAPTKSGV